MEEIEVKTVNRRVPHRNNAITADYATRSSDANLIKLILSSTFALIPSFTSILPSRTSNPVQNQVHSDLSTRMPPPIRQRFNSKARQSTLGGSSHKKRRKSKSGSNVDAEHEGEWHGFENGNGNGDGDDGMHGEEEEGKLDMVMKDEQVRKREERAAVSVVATGMGGISNLTVLIDWLDLYRHFDHHRE